MSNETDTTRTARRPKGSLLETEVEALEALDGLGRTPGHDAECGTGRRGDRPAPARKTRPPQSTNRSTAANDDDEVTQ